MFFNNQDIANADVTEKAVLYSRSRFSWELSEIGAAKPDGARLLREAPAAFGRLCVETNQTDTFQTTSNQPPSGGCVLKPYGYPLTHGQRNTQPPSGGCVLKQNRYGNPERLRFQPPSGGCVLKQARPKTRCRHGKSQPPSGGCVLKPLATAFPI